MKHFFAACSLLLGALCMPAQLMAQNSNNANHPESYYLEGAVPLTNGKVIFQKTFNVEGMSRQEVYNKVYSWLEKRMSANQNNSRISYSDEANGKIAAVGDEYIVFSNTMLALDRTKILYQLIASCEEGSCSLTVRNIYYDYPGEKEKIAAENWIDDDYALNKDKTKLVYGVAKFRRKTIDWVDDMNDSLIKELSGYNQLSSENNREQQAARNSNAVVSIAPAITVTTATLPKVQTEDKTNKQASATPTVPETPANTPTETTATPQPQQAANGYEVLPPMQLSADRVQASQGRLVIMIGSDAFNRTTMTADAGGYLSKLDGKACINTILAPGQPFQILASASEYTVCFYPNGAEKPTVIMSCRNTTTDKPQDGRANIFTGEITKVEILK